MPASRPLASCRDLLDVLPIVCPGCEADAPLWRWVRLGGLRTLTHDGDLICPKDRAFGYTPARAPLSRTEDAEILAAPCQACGAHVLHFGWVNLDGVGVLFHDTADGSEPCPVSTAFNWETGERLAPASSVVAA